MIILKLLLCGGLLTFFATTALLIEEHSLTLSNHIKPEHYIIKFILYEENVYFGECIINIHILLPTHSINLHSNVTCIKNIELTDDPPRFQKSNHTIRVYKPIKYSRDNKEQIVEFSFMNELPSGRYTLVIKFIGSVADNGGFRAFSSMKEEKIGGWIAATHFGTTGARRLFPCWDNSELKATFDISVLHRRNYRVFSNMPVQKITIIKNFMSWTHFYVTPAISTYLVTTVVIRSELYYIHEMTDNETIHICYSRYASPHQLYAEEVILNVTLCLESEWKRSEMNTKIMHIAIPFQSKGMVTFGLVLYKESDILYNKYSDPIARKFEVAHLLGQKIVQERFSNVLNSTYPLYSTWINTVLIPFIGINIINRALPDARIMDLFVVQIQHECLHLDVDYNMWPETTNSITISYCKKGLVLLRMLQHTFITEETFWNVARTYFYTKEYENKTKNQYEDKKTLKLLLNLTNSMNIWAIQKYYPVINVTQNYFNYSIINVRGNFYDSRMALTFTTQNHINFVNTLPLLWLTKESPSKRIILNSTNDWIIFNIQQTGYYRVNYDSKNWQRISNYLDSENYMKIHVLNRAQIIDDAFHFMIARKLDSSLFWNLTTYLKREEDYVAWYPMFKALEYMSSIFPLQEQKVNDIKEKMREILNVLFEKLKYDEDFLNNENDLRKCLKQEIAKWACLFQSNICQEKANRELIHHLENPKHKLLPWWKEWTYCNGVQAFNPNTWWTIFYNKFKYQYKILKFLACSKDPSYIKAYLDLIKNSESSSIDPQVERDLVNNFLVTLAKHAMNNNILTYIFKNYENIKLRQIYTIVTLIVIINNTYSVEQLNKLIEYFNKIIIMKWSYDIIAILMSKSLSDEEHKDWEVWLFLHFPEIKKRMKLRQNEIENQLTYLENLSN